MDFQEEKIRTEKEWCEIRPAEIIQGATSGLSSSRARLWALVLEARDVPQSTIHKDRSWVILVPAEDLFRAEEEIRIFEEKNRFWPPTSSSEPSQDNVLLTLSILMLLGIFHNLRMVENGIFGMSSVKWLESGSMQAGKVLAGQWWRLVTALSLHADWLHLLGNLAAGSLFIGRLCQVFGSGWGWALVLASGASGNLLNALLQSPSHTAVGASTAIFGAVGLLSARAATTSGKARSRRRALPFAAGLALLALLGSSGENTDLGAHLWGYVSGLALGMIFSRLKSSGSLRTRKGNAFAGATALIVFLGSWLWALTSA